MLGSWSEHADELLYDGERIQQRVDLEAATIVVTNERVLAFTPDGDGPNYRHVDRPNVARVSVETESALGQLVWGTVVLFLGVGFFLLATMFNLTSLVDGVTIDDPTGVADGALEAVETLLAVFDLTIIALGVLFVTVAAVFFVRYIRSRSRHLAFRVSGDDDIVLEITDAELEAGRAATLQNVIGPGQTSEVDSTDPVSEPGPIGDLEESG